MRNQAKLTVLRDRFHTYRARLWAVLWNWGIVLAGLVVERAATALALILVARRVAPAFYGQYFSVFSLANFLVVLPSYGLDAWLLTQTRSDDNDLISLWSNAVRSRGRMLVLWIIAMSLAGLVLPAGTFPAALLIPTVIGTAFDSLVMLSYAALRCTNRHWLVSLMQSASALILLGTAAALPNSAAAVTLFALARMALSGMFFLVAIGLIGARALLHPPQPMLQSQIQKAARPFLWAEISSAIYVRADVNIVSFLVGSAGTSVYGPAINLLQVTFLPPRALFFLMVPRLSRTHSRTRTGFVRSSILQLAAQFVTGTALSLALFFLAPILIELTFGSAYRQSAEVLRLLSPIPLFRSLNFGLGALLTSGERQAERTRSQAIAAIFNLAANLLVIGPFGIPGVALVYAASEGLLCLGYLASLFHMSKNWVSKTGAPSS
jgi:O-antigen/teichoic acid export membrane protein